MTKAELNAHRALPDETFGDSYTMTHKREREAFVKGWDKAVELCCDWLRTHSDADYFELISNWNYCGAGNLNKKKMIEDFKKYMEE